MCAELAKFINSWTRGTARIRIHLSYILALTWLRISFDDNLPLNICYKAADLSLYCIWICCVFLNKTQVPVPSTFLPTFDSSHIALLYIYFCIINAWLCVFTSTDSFKFDSYALFYSTHIGPILKSLSGDHKLITSGNFVCFECICSDRAQIF